MNELTTLDVDIPRSPTPQVPPRRRWHWARVAFWVGIAGGYGVFKWYNDPWRVAAAEHCDPTNPHSNSFLVCKDKAKVKCDPTNPYARFVPGCQQATIDPLKPKAATSTNDQLELPPFLVTPEAFRQPDLWEVFWLAVSPPALLLLLGAILYWVASGFHA